MATAYTNTGGTGDRRLLIAVTDPGDFGGDVTGLINGSTADDASYFNGDEATNYWLRFDFDLIAGPGSKVIINEAKWYQEMDAANGDFQWEASDDAASWTAIGSPFALGTMVQTITALSGNSTAYRYYRMRGVAGMTSTLPYLREIEFKIEVVPPAAAYWRLLIYNHAGSTILTIADWKLYDTFGTQIATTGGTASASNGTAANAFDSTIGTLWSTSTLPTYVSPHWLQYQFASPVSPASITITARNDASYYQAPAAFAVQRSSNGSTWTTVGYFGKPWTTAGQINTYAFGPASGFGSNYRIFVLTNDGGTPTSIADIVYKNISAANLSLVNGAAYASTVFNGAGTYSPPLGHDANVNTFWGAADATSGQWLAYRFSGPTIVGSFTMTARVGSPNQTPRTFKLQKSNDNGVTWYDIQSFSVGAWSGGATRTLTVDSPTTGYVRSAKNFTASGTTCAASFTGGNASGNCLIAAVGVKGGGFPSPTVTDSAGNTWRKVVAGPRATSSGQSQAFVFVAQNCIGTGSNTVTATVSGGATIDMAVAEYYGVATVDPVDQIAATQATATSLSNYVFTQSTYQEILTIAYHQTVSPVMTPTAGWTLREQTTNTDTASIALFDRAVTAGGTYTNTVTVPSSSFAYHLLTVTLSYVTKPRLYIQSNNAAATFTATIARAYQSNNTAGNFLVLSIGAMKSGTLGTISSVADSAGNTWELIDSTALGTEAGKQAKSWLYWVPSCVAGANTVTVTFSAAPDDMCMIISEYSPPKGLPVSQDTLKAAGGGANFTTMFCGNAFAEGTGDPGVVYSSVFDRGIQGQGFKPADSGDNWKMRENGSSSVYGTSICTFDQVAYFGTYVMNLTLQTASPECHSFMVAFTPTDDEVVGVQPMMMMVIT